MPPASVISIAAMWRAGRLPVEKLVSARITLDDINDALDELAAGRAIRQVIEFGEAGDRT